MTFSFSVPALQQPLRVSSVWEYLALNSGMYCNGRLAVVTLRRRILALASGYGHAL